MALSFRDQVEVWAKATERDVKDVTKNIVKGMTEQLLAKSPVGGDDAPDASGNVYLGGKYKGNWRVGISSPDTTFNENVADPNGYNTRMSLDREIDMWDGEGSIFISNSAPYARRLEYGWSGQAPRGIVRVVVRNFQTIVSKQIRKNS